jgi:AAA15 family ATPase/GTPase
MEIRFEGKYKSITSFHWLDIPDFVVLTGLNGAGKSQLLNLIYEQLSGNLFHGRGFSLIGLDVKAHEVTYQKGEWELQNTAEVSLVSIKQRVDAAYNNFRSYLNKSSTTHFKWKSVFDNLVSKLGTNPHTISREEFENHFPQMFLEQESEISRRIGEIFYDYRLLEIDLLAQSKSESEIEHEIGKKPWTVLREIVRESKLPFIINDPSNLRIKDNFRFTLKHEGLDEEVNFNDLSSGEKVLMSLIFYLYNSTERKTFPKLLLLDEPDAHLHPSMTQQFLNVIKNVLVEKYKVQVIMTTHSPSTVVLAPEESIFEMSISEPRIKKTPSKNHTVSLLTSGLVYVGKGTKYFIVEDEDDVEFYSFAYEQLLRDSRINGDIPLVFIPASSKRADKSGGKSVVRDWVDKLTSTGLTDVIGGLIDKDSGNKGSQDVHVLDRYSIENYLADPIVVFATLLDQDRAPAIHVVNVSMGEEYKLLSLGEGPLQEIADYIISKIEGAMPNFVPDFEKNGETERVHVEFVNGKVLSYPKWLLERRGKDLLGKVYNSIWMDLVNHVKLFKAFKRLKMIPSELKEKFDELKGIHDLSAASPS